MKNSIYIILLILIAIVSFVSGTKLCHKKSQHTVKTTQIVDTIIITDTVVKYEPTYITKRVTDTLYLPSDSNKQQPLVIEQKHYQDKGIYDAWISGYNAQLDSIKTYPQIKETTITKTITKEIEKKGLNIYPYIGTNNFNHRLNPVMGIATEINNNTIFIGEMGHINDRLYYGVRIGFKIN